MKFHPFRRSGTIAPAEPGSLPIAALPPRRDEREEPAREKRRFYSAASNAGFLSWDVQNVSADTAIYGTINRVKARCRDLARNNDYVKHFLRLLKSNVVGPNGFRLRVRRWNGKTLHRAFNSGLEDHWRKAGKLRNLPTVCGQLTRRELAELWITTLAVDGEVFEVFYPGYSNKYRFASKIVDASLIDWTKNGLLPNGNRCKMGVELDAYDKPVAYWVLNHHPNELLFDVSRAPTHTRIGADQARLTFLHEFPGQTRGVSWLASPAVRAQMLQKFEEAVIIASRAAASKGGFYKLGDEFAGNAPGDDEGESGDFMRRIIEPGEWEQLPRGVEPVPYDPTFPQQGLDMMAKVMLRGVASGLGASYVSMANNLEGVNYSSIRSGDLEMRSIYRGLQQFAIDHHEEPYFEAWVQMLALKSDSGLNLTHLLRCMEEEEYRFLARGWQWVDPLKEVAAHEKAIALRLTTRGRVVAETTGEDIEDILDEAEEEERMMAERGMDPSIGAAAKPPGKEENPEQPPADEDEEEDPDAEED